MGIGEIIATGISAVLVVIGFIFTLWFSGVLIIFRVSKGLNKRKEENHE